MDAEIAADLRDALGRHPDDEPLRQLIADLRRACPPFARLWEAGPAAVAPRTASRKTTLHPEVGEITLDCDVLTVAGSDLRLVVYTAAPGSVRRVASEARRSRFSRSFEQVKQQPTDRVGRTAAVVGTSAKLA